MSTQSDHDFWRKNAADYTDFEDFVSDFASGEDDLDDFASLVAELFNKPVQEVRDGIDSYFETMAQIAYEDHYTRRAEQGWRDA